MRGADSLGRARSLSRRPFETSAAHHGLANLTQLKNVLTLPVSLPERDANYGEFFHKNLDLMIAGVEAVKHAPNLAAQFIMDEPLPKEAFNQVKFGQDHMPPTQADRVDEVWSRNSKQSFTAIDIVPWGFYPHGIPMRGAFSCFPLFPFVEPVFGAQIGARG